MLSLPELRRVVSVLHADLAGAPLDRIIQPDAFALVLVFRGAAEKRPLLLSCRPRFARISELETAPQAPPRPPAFAEHLRAHLRRSRLAEVQLRGDDRQVVLRLEGREGAYALLLSILGPRSNLYLLDADGLLRLSLRPLAETRRDLALGQPWRDPETRPPSAGEDRFADVADAGLLTAIETRYRLAEGEAEIETRVRRLEQAFRRQEAAHGRKRRRLAADEAEGAKAGDYRRQGELLKSALGRVRRRAASVTVQDYATGEEVSIPLDPSLGPRENLERLFRRYHKAAKKAVVAAEEGAALEAREAELAELRAELDALARSCDAPGLDSFAARPGIRHILGRFAPVPGGTEPPTRSRRKRGALPTRLQPRRYRSSDGLEIWVGKNDDGNDHLTTRLARGHDLFFHLEGSPGSHVVLRTGGREDPPADSLLEACEIAVHFSKQKAASRARVHVAAIKDVRKPAGAKPGLVHVFRGRNVELRRDPARLQRILASRIDA